MRKESSQRIGNSIDAFNKINKALQDLLYV